MNTVYWDICDMCCIFVGGMCDGHYYVYCMHNVNEYACTGCTSAFMSVWMRACVWYEVHAYAHVSGHISASLYMCIYV